LERWDEEHPSAVGAAGAAGATGTGRINLIIIIRHGNVLDQKKAVRITFDLTGETMELRHTYRIHPKELGPLDETYSFGDGCEQAVLIIHVICQCT
jgi:hypothetical protein